MYKILAVDDEEKNLKLIKAYFEDVNYEVTCAHNGNEAWDLLHQGSPYDLILLDRMMPQMDGMELLKKIKSDAALNTLPIIMQTAAAEKAQMLEGIKAGVHYYLTKPYDEETIISLVDACLRDYDQIRNLRNKVIADSRMIGLVQECTVKIRSIKDASDAANYIANLCPDPENAIIGLLELLVNSIEHGNLGITYAEKSQLTTERKMDEEIQRRLSLPENKDKYATLSYKHTPDKIILEICDAGDGFDWEDYLELSPERAMHNHGRGIAMANRVSFDTLIYKGKGNIVECTIALRKDNNDQE